MIRLEWVNRVVDSVWFDRANAVLLIGAVTAGAIAALIRQTSVFVIAMLWIWTVCAISTGYSLGLHRQRGRHSP
jgi:hypothetical protein